MQFEREINIYSDEAILKRFQANETSISVVQGKISALISESELIELENSNATMYSKLASAVLDIDSLNVNFSELNTKYNTVSGQYTELNSKVANYKASVDGLSANVSQISQNLENNYSTTTAMNAAIKASVDGLSSTVSKTYATTTQLNTAKSDAISSAKSYTDSAKASALTTAKGYADDAEAAANTNTKNLLKSYSTTAQMNSAIKQKADEISTSVSATYATKTSVTTAQNNAVSTAKDYTDSAKASALTTAKGYADAAEDAANTNTKNLLKSYSTTTQMNSAITQKANEISADISAVETNLNNNYSTTTKMNAAIKAAADGVSSEVSAVNTKLENNYSTTTKVSTMISQSARDLRVEIQNAENDAKKVATNFLSYDATNGLLIGNKQNGSWQGFRSQITSSAFNILNSSGTQIASYGASMIELGKNSENSIIKLCGGKGQLKYTKNIQSIEYSGTKYNALEMISENIVLSSSDLETHIRNNGRRNGTNEDGRYVNSYVLCEKYKTKIGYRSGASSSSYDQQSSITVNDNMISIDSNGRAEINCKDFEIVSDGDIYLSTTENKGNIYLNHRRFDVNVLLWSGGYHMNASHTANLSKKISTQKTGIVLVFNQYDNGTTRNSWHAFFIPKYVIMEVGSGMPWDFWMGQSNFSRVCGKGLYIYDDHITGADANVQSGTANGITYKNTDYVLRYVVGI